MAFDSDGIRAHKPKEGMRGEGWIEVNVHRNVSQREKEEKDEGCDDRGFADDHPYCPEEEENEEDKKAHRGWEGGKKVSRVEAEGVSA